VVYESIHFWLDSRVLHLKLLFPTRGYRVGIGAGMSQKTQQGLGPGPSNPFESDEEDVPASERITPVDSERGRMLAKAAEAALREARRSSPSGARESEPLSLDAGVVPTSSEAHGADFSPVDEPNEETKPRSDFDTVPGGGVNRESGGRGAARAYVSPKTPIMLKEGRLALISVDVDPDATSDSRSFPTEKALRPASIIPPAIATMRPAPARRSIAPYGIAIATAAILSGIIAYVAEFQKAPVAVSSVSAAKPVGEPSPEKGTQTTPPSPSVPQASAAGSASPTPSSLPSDGGEATAGVAPVNRERSSASEEKSLGKQKESNASGARPINKPPAPATSAATKPAASSTKSGSEDVWLE
jgi:hypothetical protein